MWRSSEYLCTQDISTAGTHSMPASAAAATASGRPRPRRGRSAPSPSPRPPPPRVATSPRVAIGHPIPSSELADRSWSAHCTEFGTRLTTMRITRKGRLRGARGAGARRCARWRARQGRAARRSAGDPAAVPGAHPARAEARPAGPRQARRARRLLARAARRRDHGRRRDPGGRGPARQHPGLRPRRTPTTRAPPSACATSGSPCAPTCARSSSRSPWRTSARTGCRSRSAAWSTTRTPG